jgi:hypothetical protein
MAASLTGHGSDQVGISGKSRRLLNGDDPAEILRGKYSLAFWQQKVGHVIFLSVTSSISWFCESITTWNAFCIIEA